MAKKPADQTSSNGAGGAGDAVDLEQDLDGEGAGSGASDDEDDDDDEDESGSGGTGDIGAQVAAAVAAQMGLIQKTFQSEMDRRINTVVAKLGKKPAAAGKGEQDGEDEQVQEQAAPAADVRGARMSFREALPESIKLVSTEERALANEFGQNLIRARALQGFEDEEQVGLEVALATAEFLKKARNLYSSRTKRLLEKQGALVKQGDGRGPGGDVPPANLASAFAAAEKKDRELFPHRYADK